MLLASVVQPSTNLLCGGRISFQNFSGGPIAIKTTWFNCPKGNKLKT